MYHADTSHNKAKVAIVAEKLDYSRDNNVKDKDGTFHSNNKINSLSRYNSKYVHLTAELQKTCSITSQNWEGTDTLTVTDISAFFPQ